MKDYIKKILKKEDKKHKEKSNIKWILLITFLSFTISIVFTFLSESILANANVFIGVLVVIIFILIGILFDMIGVAVTAASEKPFHSMSSKKIRGANIAVIFKKNAPKLSSFCNDVIGDVCGIVSGSAGVYIATYLSDYKLLPSLIASLLITGIIAALTIGGKALGKSMAINKSTFILYEFSKFISYFYNHK